MSVKFTNETPWRQGLILVCLLMAGMLSANSLYSEAGCDVRLHPEADNAPLTTNFITEWSYPDGSTSIIFSAQTSGSVNYTWTAAPSGNSGSGSFSQASVALVTLSGLDIAAGDVVTLTMEPTNLRWFNMLSNLSQRANLSKVTQWGSVPWSSLARGFNDCPNLTITATDAPNLSGVTDLGYMFAGCTAMNQDISHWDVSTVTNFEAMFQGATTFNQDISTWNMASATQLRNMFSHASAFNQPIGVWNTENVTNMSDMFYRASVFNQDLSTWNTAKVTNFSRMFSEATAFNQPIGGWNTSAAVNMFGMFAKATAFNQPIGNWNLSNVTTINSMFSEAIAFNQPIGDWNTSSVTDMSAVFNLTVFNQPIGDWNTGNVTNMGGLFNGATAFNQNINTWNTSKVTNFLNTFNRATAFNQPLDNWNTGAVTNMRSMFERASAFNQSIGNWNTSSVTNMRTMFLLASNFNQDLSAWDVSKVTDLTGMLLGASAFNQSLGSWSLNASVQMGELLNNCGMNCSNYSRTLYEWAQNPNIPSGRTLGATSRQYGPDAITARATLVSGKGWIITGDSPGTGACAFPRPFVTEWVFTNADTIIQFNALTTGGSVTYTWSARPSGTSGSGSFTQATAGAVSLGGLTISAGDTVTLNLSTDNLSRFYMLNATAAAKLRDVKQWSTVAWTSMASAFANCSNLRITATDSPILTGVISMANMFDGASVFNTDISGWNTATVTDMSGTFKGAAAFDQDINSWNTANVSDFSDMFNAASVFNQSFADWSFNQATDLTGFISNTGLDCENYTKLLLKLANNPNTPQGLTLGATNLGYGTGGVNARNKLINDFGWTIVGDELGTEPCVNCPDLSNAPAEVLVTNSTCTSNCTPSGGSFAVPTSPCPDGAFLQYQVNGGRLDRHPPYVCPDRPGADHQNALYL
jgi:surface protein